MNGKTKLLAYSLGGLALAVLAFFLLVSPALRKVATLSEQELAARSEVMRLDQQINAYRTAQSDLSKASNKNLLFDSIVDDKNLFVPIEELEAGVRNTNSAHQLKILRESLDPLASGEAEPVKVLEQAELEEVPYTLTARGIL